MPPYTGPLLVGLVAACTAPDGSYWAVQSWQRLLPMRGIAPCAPAVGAFGSTSRTGAGRSHMLDVSQNWTYDGTWTGLFGHMTYGGRARPRLQDAVRDAPRRRLRPLRLHRHPRLRLRPRLAPRRRQGPASPERRLLLQLRAGGAASRLSRPDAAAARQRRRRARHRDRPRRDAGRAVVGPGLGKYDPVRTRRTTSSSTSLSGPTTRSARASADGASARAGAAARTRRTRRSPAGSPSPANSAPETIAFSRPPPSQSQRVERQTAPPSRIPNGSRLNRLSTKPK